MKIEKRDTENDRIPYSISHVVAYIFLPASSVSKFFSNTRQVFRSLNYKKIAFCLRLSFANCLQTVCITRAIVVSRSFEFDFMM